MLEKRCRNYQSILTMLACVWFTSISVIAADQPDDDIKLIKEMRNEDVKWSGTYVGLVPTYKDERIKGILKKKNNSIASLIDALKDDRRIVVAHVLLRDITHRSFNGLSGSWLFLKVDISADGKVIIEKNSYAAVREYWKNNPPEQ